MPIRRWTLAAAMPMMLGMRIVRSAQALEWGALDLLMQGLARDWHGEPVRPPAMFALAIDPCRLWFVAGHAAPATRRSAARPGAFQAGLWQHDVAELFLADPGSGRYWEMNLAPNGAWWSCQFNAPRTRAQEDDQPLPGVVTHAELTPDGGWLAALAMPLAPLLEWLPVDPATTANVTFILGGPTPQYLTAADLGPGEPDFHRPAKFAALRWIDGEETRG